MNFIQTILAIDLQYVTLTDRLYCFPRPGYRMLLEDFTRDAAVFARYAPVPGYTCLSNYGGLQRMLANIRTGHGSSMQEQIDSVGKRLAAEITEDQKQCAKMMKDQVMASTDPIEHLQLHKAFIESQLARHFISQYLRELIVEHTPRPTEYNGEAIKWRSEIGYEDVSGGRGHHDLALCETLIAMMRLRK